jgi:hypothetical protein
MKNHDTVVSTVRTLATAKKTQQKLQTFLLHFPAACRKYFPQRSMELWHIFIPPSPGTANGAEPQAMPRRAGP